MSTRITIPAGTSLFVLAGLAAVLESDAYVAFDADRQAIADAMIQAERQDLLPLLTTYIEPNKEFPQGAQKVFNSVGQEVIQSREDFEIAQVAAATPDVPVIDEVTIDEAQVEISEMIDNGTASETAPDGLPNVDAASVTVDGNAIDEAPIVANDTSAQVENPVESDVAVIGHGVTLVGENDEAASTDITLSAEDLAGLERDDLNAIATNVGVENAAGFPDKLALVDAIVATGKPVIIRA